MTKNSRLKNTLLVALGIGFGLFAFVGCKNGSYKTTSSGLLYRMINDENSDSVKPGQFIKVNVRTVVNDSVMKEDKGQWVPVQPSSGQQFDMMEGLSLLSKGDSAEFKIPSTHIFVKVLDVQDQKGYQEALEKEKEAH